jgi:hypothetical protein
VTRGQGRRRLLRAPAVQALLIQGGALLLSAVVLYGLDALQFSLTVLHAALIQGLLAMLLTWKLGLAPWWRAIQLLFPVAVLAALALGLPSWLFLSVFLLLLGWYWSTFRTQVPYYPSTPAVWDAVRQLLPPPDAVGEHPLRVVDIGSGLGGFLLYLARVRPDLDYTGVELAPLPWLASWLRARVARLPVKLLRRDYEQLDFSRYDVVFAYLSPAAMGPLWRKARAEMRPGAMLLSYEFIVEVQTPDRTILASEEGKPLYVWCF